MKNDIIEVGGNTLQYVFTATQTKEVFQIISLILSIITTIFIFVNKVIVWYKKANEDKKIDVNEINELVDINETFVNDLEELKKKDEQ